VEIWKYLIFVEKCGNMEVFVEKCEVVVWSMWTGTGKGV